MASSEESFVRKRKRYRRYNRDPSAKIPRSTLHRWRKRTRETSPETESQSTTTGDSSITNESMSPLMPTRSSVSSNDSYGIVPTLSSNSDRVESPPDDPPEFFNFSECSIQETNDTKFQLY